MNTYIYGDYLVYANNKSEAKSQYYKKFGLNISIKCIKKLD